MCALTKLNIFDNSFQRIPIYILISESWYRDLVAKIYTKYIMKENFLKKSVLLLIFSELHICLNSDYNFYL